MSGLVIVIVIASTFMHAGWNLIARYAGSEGEFFKQMLHITLIVGFLPAVISELFTGSMTRLAWICVIFSGISGAVYFFGLARSYDLSDFTIVYPVARALPVIFIALIDIMRGRSLSSLGWVGILFVTIGSILIPQQRFGDIKLSNFFSVAVLWMFLAAAGTIGYSVLDKIAAESVDPGPATAARYAYFYFAISVLPYVVLMRSIKTQQRDSNNRGWYLVGIGTVLNFAAYWLILWVFQFSPVTSYIVAFRQFSIVIGAILGFVFFKEKGFYVRISGAVLITTGLILIGVWGS